MRGFNGTGGNGSGNGVEGKSGSGTGVFGESGAGTGVRGQSASGRGVHGASTSGAGVEGNSQSNFGIVGTSPTSAGLSGLSVNGEGILALNQNVTKFALVCFSPSTQAFGAFIRGRLVVQSQKNSAVATSKGLALLHALETPAPLFEDVGTGHLRHGRARVDLDPLFLETVDTTEYQAFLTPASPASRGLAVAARDVRGFTVQELDGELAAVRSTGGWWPSGRMPPARHECEPSSHRARIGSQKCRLAGPRTPSYPTARLPAPDDARSRRNRAGAEATACPLLRSGQEARPRTWPAVWQPPDGRVSSANQGQSGVRGA